MSEKDLFCREEDVWKRIVGLLEEIHQIKSFLHQNTWDAILYKLDQVEKELEILMMLYRSDSDKK